MSTATNFSRRTAAGLFAMAWAVPPGLGAELPLGFVEEKVAEGFTGATANGGRP
jgi:hypothetical protein